MLILEIVMGVISFIFSVASSVPQIISLRKTRNTSGISLISWIICIVDNAFWIAWSLGFYFNSMLMYKEPMTRLFQISLIILCFSYIFGSILVSYILIVKVKHLLLCKQLKVTELQLANILLDKDKKKYFVNKKWNNFSRYGFIILFITLDLLFSFAIAAILYKFAYIQPDGSKEWVWVVVLSFISSGIWEATTWPQFVKSIREKDTTGLSLFWCIFAFINCVVNFAYDLSLSLGNGGFNWNIIFVLIFSSIIPSLGVMIIKIINVKKAKKEGMSEVEYTKKVLIPLVKAKKSKQKIKSK